MAEPSRLAKALEYLGGLDAAVAPKLRAVSDAIDPVNVARRAGLNLPTAEQLSIVPHFVGPGADIEGMVNDAREGSAAFGRGDMLGALGGYGSAAAAIPMMFLPGTFAGVKSATANLAKLATAEKMAAKNADRADIWNDTGWFKGADDKWRYEIDDSVSEYRPGRLASKIREQGGSEPLTQGFQGYLPDVLDHPGVYSSHPDLKDTVWQSVPPERVGGMGGHQDGNTLRINQEYSSALKSGKSLTLHEMQHRMQDFEGFAKGGSPSEFNPGMAKEARDALSWRREVDQELSKMVPGSDRIAAENNLVQKYQELGAMDMVPSREARDWASQPYLAEPSAQKELENIVKTYGLDKQTTPRSPMEIYKLLAGEAESRNVQTRMDWTPEQRMATPPWESLDIPEDQQIVRFR